MNKVYVRTRSALVLLFRHSVWVTSFFFFTSHSFFYDLPVAVLNFKLDARRCLEFEEKKKNKRKRKRVPKKAGKRRKHARKASSNRYRGSRESHCGLAACLPVKRTDNRAQFLASLLWSGFTPSSSPFLPPSSEAAANPLLLSPTPLSRYPSAANLIEPRLRGKRLT